MPWSAVAKLQIPGVSRCTAVFVTPTLAVTAAHCLTTRALGHFVQAGSVHLLLAYDAGVFTRHIIPDAVTLAPGADPVTRGPRSDDVALLHVAEPVRDVVPLDTGAVIPGTKLTLAGFGQDRIERMVVDPDCAAGGYQRGPDGKPLLRHDCSGTRGSSGGAVLTQDAAGQWRLAGMQVGGNLAGAGGVAIPGFELARIIATTH